MTYSFPDLEPVHCSMSSSNCCLLSCIQTSQEAGQVSRRIFHTVIHTVKGFGIINKAEVDVFLELSCFFCGPADVDNLISGSFAFSKSNWNIWKSMVHVLLKPGLENLSITLLACEMSAVVWWFEHSLALPFFEIRMKTDLFQSCCHC